MRKTYTKKDLAEIQEKIDAIAHLPNDEWAKEYDKIHGITEPAQVWDLGTLDAAGNELEAPKRLN